MRRLRRRCERRLRGVVVPRPFDLGTFCTGLGELRGRPLHLLPADLPPAGPCGLWIPAPSADYIVFERSTTRLHQEHIVLHEIGHIIGGHHGADAGPRPPGQGPAGPGDAPGGDPGGDPADGLFPSLDPHALRAVFARTRYSTPEECEAEMIASLIHERIDRRPLPGPATSATGAAVARLEASLDLTEDR